MVLVVIGWIEEVNSHSGLWLALNILTPTY